MINNKPLAPRIGKLIIIFLVLAILIGVVLYAIYLYSFIESSRLKDLSITKSKLIQTGQMTEITEMYHFQDKEAYHIFFGLNKDKNNIIIFVPVAQDDDELTVIDTDKTLPEEKAKQRILDECSSCDIIATSPAMIDDRPLWEVTYFDKKNRYVIHSLSFYDVSLFDQI